MATPRSTSRTHRQMPRREPQRGRAAAADPDAAFATTLDRSGNLEDAAYAQMRQALIDGRFSPGQTFTIRALAQAFGTSPMPVRDALKRLVAERGLDLLRNRSVIVPM